MSALPIAGARNNSAKILFTTANFPVQWWQRWRSANVVGASAVPRQITLRTVLTSADTLATRLPGRLTTRRAYVITSIRQVVEQRARSICQAATNISPRSGAMLRVIRFRVMFRRVEVC
jgi:hypothetical protein